MKNSANRQSAVNGTPDTRVNGASDTRGILAALDRAHKRAHLIAHETGTNISTRIDGKLVEVPPNPKYYNAPEVQKYRGRGLGW